MKVSTIISNWVGSHRVLCCFSKIFYKWLRNLTLPNLIFYSNLTLIWTTNDTTWSGLYLVHFGIKSFHNRYLKSFVISASVSRALILRVALKSDASKLSFLIFAIALENAILFLLELDVNAEIPESLTHPGAQRGKVVLYANGACELA